MGKFFFVAVAGLAAAASGQFQPLDQVRSVDAQAFVHNGFVARSDDEEVSRSASSFDLFEERIEARAEVAELESGSDAWQYSIVGEYGVIASGSAAVALDRPIHPDSIVSAQGESGLSITFLLPAPASVFFEAQVSTLDDLLGVDLYSSDLSFVASAGWNVSTEVRYQGVLPAGEYNLYAFTQLYREAYAGEGPVVDQRDWSFHFTVPGAPSAAAGLVLGVIAMARRRR